MRECCWRCAFRERRKREIESGEENRAQGCYCGGGFRERIKRESGGERTEPKGATTVSYFLPVVSPREGAQG